LHARCIYENGKWFVEDLDSTNGTFVNGSKVEKGFRALLNKGDTLTLSSVAVLIVL